MYLFYRQDIGLPQHSLFKNRANELLHLAESSFESMDPKMEAARPHILEMLRFALHHNICMPNRESNETDT
jgi:hypothetical protein